MRIYAIDSSKHLAKNTIFHFAHLLTDFLEFTLSSDGKIVNSHALILGYNETKSKSF